MVDDLKLLRTGTSVRESIVKAHRSASYFGRDVRDHFQIHKLEHLLFNPAPHVNPVVLEKNLHLGCRQV